MSNATNGKTYTEVLLDVYEKIDTVEQRVTGKLDAVIRDNSEFMARLAAGDERFHAIDDKIDACRATLGKDISENSKTIEKVRNLNTFIALLGSTIAGIIGVNK